MLVLLLIGAAPRWFTAETRDISQAVSSACLLLVIVPANVGVYGASSREMTVVGILNSELREKKMLWTVFVTVLVLWVLGVIANIGTGLIHLLLIVAFVALVFSLVSGRRGMA